ncbi:TPR repeat family protein, partial [Chlamydia psittaci 84-8471/1]
QLRKKEQTRLFYHRFSRME